MNIFSGETIESIGAITLHKKLCEPEICVEFALKIHLQRGSIKSFIILLLLQPLISPHARGEYFYNSQRY